MSKLSYMSRILRMVSKGSSKQCDMCKDSKVGKRWEYRSQTLIPDYLPEIVLICAKCAYRENYGTKYYKKAMKQKILEKLNHNFGNTLPKVED